MFQLGLINSIFWCVGAACLILMILLAIKGKRPLLTVLSIVFGVVMIFNLAIAADDKLIAHIFESAVKDWTKIHDYIFYSLVIADVACAICLLFVKNRNINDKLWKWFAIINIVTTIACNIFNFYTGSVNYKYIKPLANDTPQLLYDISMIILYVRLAATLGFGVALLFVKPEEEPAELELITEVDAKPATELPTATDTAETEEVEETATEEPEVAEAVAEQPIEEKTTEPEVIEEQPTEEPEEEVEKTTKEQPQEETITEEEQPTKDTTEEPEEEEVEGTTEPTEEVEVVEETAEEPTEEVKEENRFDDTAKAVVAHSIIDQATETEEQPANEPSKQSVEETSTEEIIEEQPQVIETVEEQPQEVTTETIEETAIEETEQQQTKQPVEEKVAVVVPIVAKDKPKKKLSKSKRRVRPTRKFINFIRNHKTFIQIPNMVCKNCGTQTHSESKICPRCFHKMVPLYKCPKCDTLNETLVCSNCGAQIGKNR